MLTENPRSTDAALRKWRSRVLGLGALFAAITIASALVTLPKMYIRYHEWQMDRAAAEVFANQQDGAPLDRVRYHRDRLVAAGVYELFQYKFQHVDATSPNAHAIVRQIVARQTPPHTQSDSFASQPGGRLEISILCRPEDADAWRAFVARHDGP